MIQSVLFEKVVELLVHLYLLPLPHQKLLHHLLLLSYCLRIASERLSLEQGAVQFLLQFRGKKKKSFGLLALDLDF